MFLNAAEGWLGLGDHLAANQELEQISPELRGDPRVLDIRLQIYWKAENWVSCIEIADALVRLVPGNEHGWVARSFALHELKRTQEAFDLLLPTEDKFQKSWVIPYNLACYCAQLGHVAKAKDWFSKAVAIDEETVKRQASDDPDLKPLWDSMTGILWRKE
jgi:predicted Zn-dependent protease